MARLMHTPEELLKMSPEELDEALLNENYNKANLREVIRRLVKLAQDYKRAYEYEKMKLQEDGGMHNE